MNATLISVLMTAYNREAFIAEAIESVLSSTYKNFELIIVDDCSKDKTVSIAKKYAHNDSRIKVYENEINLKDYPNRNKAASYAKGDYIMYADSDDILFPFAIEYCLGLMLEDETADFGIYSTDKFLSSKLLDSNFAINYHFFQNPFLVVGPGATIIKKIFFNKILYYPTKYGPANDMYFNLKAAVYGKVKVIDKAFFMYRRHDGQEQNNEYGYLYNRYNFLKDAVNELPFNLSDNQKEFINKKNKRRFVVNCFKYFFSTCNFYKTIQLFKLTNFTFKDTIEGVFHK